jgi:hypothetical protein
MAHMAYHLILKMEIGDKCLCTQHMVGVGEVIICLIEVAPSIGLVAKILKNYGECRDWRSTEEFNESIGTSYFILDVEVELLQICGPILMVVILHFFVCLPEL